jgi:hypothetical protein
LEGEKKILSYKLCAVLPPETMRGKIGMRRGVFSRPVRNSIFTAKFPALNRFNAGPLSNVPLGRKPARFETSHPRRSHHNEFIPAVLGPGRFTVAGIGRIILAAADGHDALRINAERNQMFAGRERASFSQ